MINIMEYKSKYQRTKDRGGDYMNTLNKIKNKSAMELLLEYKIPTTPPINISLLLEKIGISTIAKDFTEIEKILNEDKGSILGAAFSNKSNLAIFYKKDDTYHRKLFTIAHELGHCCLHSDDLEIEHIQFRRDANNIDQLEFDANIFAGELLIPTEQLLKYYKKFIFPSLKILSEIFNVSTNVMAKRLDYLKLEYFKDSEINEE